MALDCPEAVARVAVFDIAPTATMYARTDKEFATRYFWWFFLIQPEPLPERLIAADPEFFLRTHIAGQSRTPGSTSEAVFQEYLRAYRDPATRHAICEDYRAAATIDLDHDAAGADRRIAVPLLALWGAKGTVGRLYDVLETWREKALDVRGRALDCGHTLQEEAPDAVLAELDAFLWSAQDRAIATASLRSPCHPEADTSRPSFRSPRSGGPEPNTAADQARAGTVPLRPEPPAS